MKKSMLNPNAKEFTPKYPVWQNSQTKQVVILFNDVKNISKTLKKSN